ncbi:hypothetical protein JKY72_00220 [Candidatus Gracilibacteria bacterium]|nr:hypothetical protein [Candidatus Gracilibacteria bacterium]
MVEESENQIDYELFKSRCYAQVACGALLDSMGKFRTIDESTLYQSLFARFFDDAELDFGDSFDLEILGADMEFQCLSEHQFSKYAEAESSLIKYLIDRGFIEDELAFVQSDYQKAFRLFICRQLEELLDVNWGGGQLQEILAVNAKVAINVERIVGGIAGRA